MIRSHLVFCDSLICGTRLRDHNGASVRESTATRATGPGGLSVADSASACGRLAATQSKKSAGGCRLLNLNEVLPALLLLVSLFVMGGCRTLPNWLGRQQAPLPPEAFIETPTLDEVVYAVNANTDRVEQLETEDAALRVEGIPTLRANLAYQRPQDFRLRAQLSQFTGRELDMGSNDELFWFWVRRDEQPSVYYARHAEFAASPMRELVPLEPNRLVAALGLVRLAEDERHSGPTLRESDLLEVRSQIPSPRGDLTRVLLLDATYGWMTELHYYDANGQLLLSARADEHRYYREEAVTMPHHVEVQLLPGRPAQMAFDVDVSRYVLNRLSGSPSELFAMPEIDNAPPVNIAAPGFQPPVATASRPHATRQAVPRPTRSGKLSRGAVPPPTSFHTPSGPTLPDGGPQSVYRPTRTSRLPAYRGYR